MFITVLSLCLFAFVTEAVQAERSNFVGAGHFQLPEHHGQWHGQHRPPYAPSRVPGNAEPEGAEGSGSVRPFPGPEPGGQLHFRFFLRIKKCKLCYAAQAVRLPSAANRFLSCLGFINVTALI